MPDNRGDANPERQLENWANAPSDLSPELQAKISGTLTDSLRPVQALASRSRLALTILVGYAVLAMGLIGILNKAGFSLMSPAQMAGMSAILAGGGVLFSFALAGQMIPASRQWIPFWCVVAGPGLALLAGAALLFPWQMPSRFIDEGWPCAALELAIAVPGTLLAWTFARRGALFASGRSGAILTGLAVFLALLPLQFQCMFQQAPHLLVWHGGMAAVLIAAGAFAGSARRRRGR